ncbi:hypothetical protein Hanom_Chr01g00074621 [Helianthus anomalus]
MLDEMSVREFEVILVHVSTVCYEVWCLLSSLITVVQGLFFSVEDDTRVCLFLNRQSSVCRSSVQGLMYYNFVYSSEKGGLDWKEKIVDCGRNLLFCLLRYINKKIGINNVFIPIKT